MKDVLAWSMVALSVLTITQKRVFHGVMMRMALSIMAVGSYFMLLAPDVALTEALVGALLTTYVYILLVRNPHILKVGFVERKILFEKKQWGYDGLEYELLKGFCDSYGYTMEIVEYKNTEELVKAINEGEVDVACGSMTGKGIPILPTKIFYLKNGEVKDFLGMAKDDFEIIDRVEESNYTLLFDEHENEFLDFIQNMKEKGEFDRLVRKYAG